MSLESDPSRGQLRWGVYWLLITLAIGSVGGRILAVNSVDRTKYQAERIKGELKKWRAAQEAKGFSGDVLAEKQGRKELELRDKLRLERPFLSGNDRSRWCTIRALVEDGTYAIDQIVADPKQRSMWDTIDMVKHDRSGQPHLYSSKPTLLPTLLAGEYWLVRQLTGLTLVDDTHTVGRIMLLSINIPALVIIFILLARMAERFGTTDWGRVFVMAAATFGTLLTTFAVALNNHLIAAASAMIALYAAARIWYDGESRLRYFAVAGLFAAFAAANELPALGLFGLLGLALLIKAPRPTLLAGIPAAAVVVAAALGTNYAAHKTVLPAYAYRTAGEDWQSGNWYNYTYQVGEKTVDSYWKRDPEHLERRSIIDRGEPSQARYALHALVGHHGVFSLTPIWLLSLAGVLMMLRGGGETSLRSMGLLIAILTLLCLAFYLSQPVENRNYGGTSSGLRWMFWFAPLWLVGMLPAADWTARGAWRRIIAAVLLAFSVMSASYPTWNPWTHPWIANWMVHMEWLEL